MAGGIGAVGAYGSAGALDAMARIKAEIIARQQQAFENTLKARSADRADQALTQQGDLQRAQLASLQQERDATIQSGREKQAQGVAESLGEPSIGQPLQPSTVGVLRAGNLGETVQHQTATLPSTQDQGIVAMPQLRGRVIQPSGAMSPEQGSASSGAATSTAMPGNPEQDVYRGTGTQRHQADQTTLLRGMLRAMPAGSPLATALGYEEATGKSLPAGVLRPSLDQIGAEAEAKAKANAKYRQAPTVVVQTVGEDGKPVTKIVPKTAGSTFAKPAGATVENRLASAQAVNQTGEDIIAKLSDPAYAAQVGPAMGRASKLRDFIGDPPPEFSELAGAIESYALANMGVHGMRSAQGAEQIARLLDQHHTPASLIATIRGLNKFSSHFMENEGRAPKTTAKPSAADLIAKYGQK